MMMLSVVQLGIEPIQQEDVDEFHRNNPGKRLLILSDTCFEDPESEESLYLASIAAHALDDAPYFYALYEKEDGYYSCLVYDCDAYELKDIAGKVIQDARELALHTGNNDRYTKDGHTLH